VAERLVIVEDPGALERLRVTHRASPRLVVADVGDALPPGVSELGDDAGLDEQERLFADAWAQRAKGPRPGEGRPWDEPGFEAP
jgi:hypothetical protein